MIQANDLRIGNAVNYLIKDDLDERKEWYDTHYIDADDIKECAEDNDVFNKFHKPIPLTEDILLKCGFEKRETNEDGVVYGILNTTVIYAMKMNGGFGYYLNGYHNDVELQYLHQLQNLYFALTGKELEINL